VPTQERFRTEKNEKELFAGSSSSYASNMIHEFQIPAPNSTPREILAWNKIPIFERLENGIPMATVHRRLVEFLDSQKAEFTPLIYQTFRMFVAREKRKTSVQPPAVFKAEEIPEKPSSSPLPLDSPDKSKQSTPKPGFDENGFRVRDIRKKSADGIFNVPPLDPKDF